MQRRAVRQSTDGCLCLGAKMKRLFTVVMAVVIVLVLAVLGVVGFLTTKYVAR